MLPNANSKEQGEKQMEAVEVEMSTSNNKGDFVKENKAIFKTFAFLGLFAIRRVKGQYVVSKVRFIIFYLCWISYPLGGFFLAGKSETWVTRYGVSYMQDTFAVLVLAVVPTLQAYSLKFMTKSLPEILQNISQLSMMEVGFETPLKIRMKSSKVTINPGTEPLHPERLFNWLPRAMVVFSIFIFFTVSSTEYLMGVDFERMDKEVPTLVVLLVCLTFPFVSTLFVVVLTRWLEIVYKALNRYCKEVMPVSDVDKVLAVCSYVDRLQKIFGLLDVGFFRYILSINAASITVGASLCMARLMQDYTQIVYLGPLVFHGFILALTCEGGERLAAQHAGLVAWLKKEIRRHKLPAVPSSPPPSLSSSSFSSTSNLLHLLDGLLEYPPQIMTLGNYKVNRGFLITSIGFVLSYGAVASQIGDYADWEDFRDVFSAILSHRKCINQCLSS
ncbi:uncharacterized protein LOC135088897 [Scylla paramamosain]|uniref:uncharacterized protein LOC135088897 n=1 Tax=Scylla paramamosain TaxID=85552 RepID=UPI003082840C